MQDGFEIWAACLQRPQGTPSVIPWHLGLAAASRQVDFPRDTGQLGALLETLAFGMTTPYHDQTKRPPSEVEGNGTGD